MSYIIRALINKLPKKNLLFLRAPTDANGCQKPDEFVGIVLIYIF